LNVYMESSKIVTTSDGISDSCYVILLNGINRTDAVKAIINELVIDYKTFGYNPYNGDTIGFEGMKGMMLKEGFNAFLTELSAALKPLGKTLYVTVQPATLDGFYFDAYDFRTIGQLADKVILMAHDYNETTMPESLLNSTYYKNT